MSGLIAIMDEIAATLVASLPTSVQVVGRANYNPTPPSIDLYPADPFRDSDGAGFGEVNGSLLFIVRARVSTADHEAGQDVLLDMMDDESGNSVAVSLLDDQTLNGLASSVKVDGPSGYAHYLDPGGQGALLGCEWRVKVLNLTT